MFAYRQTESQVAREEKNRGEALAPEPVLPLRGEVKACPTEFSQGQRPAELHEPPSDPVAVSSLTHDEDKTEKKVKTSTISVISITVQIKNPPGTENQQKRRTHRIMALMVQDRRQTALLAPPHALIFEPLEEAWNERTKERRSPGALWSLIKEAVKRRCQSGSSANGSIDARAREAGEEESRMMAPHMT